MCFPRLTALQWLLVSLSVCLLVCVSVCLSVCRDLRQVGEIDASRAATADCCALFLHCQSLLCKVISLSLSLRLTHNGMSTWWRLRTCIVLFAIPAMILSKNRFDPVSTITQANSQNYTVVCQNLTYLWRHLQTALFQHQPATHTADPEDMKSGSE